MAVSSNVDSCPIGSIIMWGSTVSPDCDSWSSWKICDGGTLSKTTYYALYNIIGDNFGSSPPPGSFYLPDLRGRFIRGVDDNAGRDPDVKIRIDMQKASIAYNGVGSVQLDDLKSHTHAYSHFPGPNGSRQATGTSTSRHHENDTLNTSSPNTISNSCPGHETRPVNAYLYFIIKVM